MNFIGSVLVEEAGEQNAFYIFMFLLLKKDMMPLYLEVSEYLKNFIGIPRTTPEELLDWATHKVSSTESISSFTQNLNVTGLLHFKVVYDALFVLFTI